MKVTCPDCTYEVPLSEDIRVGQIAICENCGAELEVTALGPIKVEAIEEEK